MHEHAREKKLIVAAVFAAALAGVVVYARHDARPPAPPAPSVNAAPAVVGSVLGEEDTRSAGLPDPSTPAETLTAAEGETRYRITAGSKASFTINEMLRGEPKTVIGITEDVTGDIALDAAAGKARIGLIAIDARTLLTDSRGRNGMLAKFILKSAEPGNEYITFKPTSIDGLPAALEEGSPFDFSITGDLTVSGTTKPVTFKAAAQLAPGDKIVGKADATILYKDFGISIPSVPMVAGVDDDLKLSIDLIAEKG
ncbi:MAG TPA: YceI family protein [Candidatus Eisenbacteria bacterium]|nr:YceI family protein [Candidatus Eisenbacteria bacterium]